MISTEQAQSGVAANVYLPKDRVTNQHMGYGFVEFRSEDDADYVSHACAQDLLLKRTLPDAAVRGTAQHLRFLCVYPCRPPEQSLE